METQQSALRKILEYTGKKLPAKVTYYAGLLGTIGIATTVIDPATLSEPAKLLFTGIGVNLLSGLIERIVRGDDPGEDDVLETVQRAIKESQIEDALTQDDLRLEILRHTNMLAEIIRQTVDAGSVEVVSVLLSENRRQLDSIRWLDTAMHNRLSSEFDALHRRFDALKEVEQDFIEPEQERLYRELDKINTPHQRRYDIGERLARIGDPRRGVGVRDGVPEIDWLPVTPCGEIEIKGKIFTVEPFYIARYLVTYEQFQAFVDAEDGFENDDWWDKMPDDYKRQELANQRNKMKNAPRDRVSWYQAVAFSRWLTHRCKGLTLPNLYPYVVGENAEIRLPTEWEWQWMAQGGESTYKYPWHGNWQEGFANTSEAGLNRTTAVGMYPHGVVGCGALDVAGNLWEWCLNDYGNPETVDGYGNGEYKVLRGGSFNFNRNLAAASYRNGNHPLNDYSSYGLRLVLCPI